MTAAPQYPSGVERTRPRRGLWVPTYLLYVGLACLYGAILAVTS